MSTKAATADYILEQLSSVDDVSARKMFGEYALYVGAKVVALICDDTLFVKITAPGKAFVADYYQEGFAYPGAKASMQIDEAQLDDRKWLTELIQLTAAALPLPKPKNLKLSRLSNSLT